MPPGAAFCPVFGSAFTVPRALDHGSQTARCRRLRCDAGQCKDCLNASRRSSAGQAAEIPATVHQANDVDERPPGSITQGPKRFARCNSQPHRKILSDAATSPSETGSNSSARFSPVDRTWSPALGATHRHDRPPLLRAASRYGSLFVVASMLIGIALASLLALATVPASAEEASETVYSAPTVRIPAASPQTRAARPSRTLGRVAPRGLVIDLGPLPAEEDTDTQVPQQSRIGIHRPLPREFKGNLVPYLDWTAEQTAAAITFRADGAVSLRVAVHATLPFGALVQVFDGDGQARGPAFAQADFDASGNLPLWLPSTEGDTLTVRIVLPSTERAEALSFSVPSVAHRFASGNAVEHEPCPECSSACPEHVDLACVDSPLVNDIADAVGLIQFEKAGSTYGCTGTLLNVSDTPDMFEPYFLTANHCVATPTVAATVEADYFYQNTNCKGTEIEIDPRFRSLTGGTELLATSPSEDATLLRFNASLPGGLTYAGWTTAEVSVGDSVFSVHHAAVPHLLAKYAEGRVEDTEPSNIWTVWTRGLMAAGASGSGLFLEEGQLVGVTSLATYRHLCDRGIVAQSTGNTHGAFRDFFPWAHRWLAPASYEIGPFTYMLPAVLGAGRDIQGFVRIRNRSDTAGEVEIYATDDAGHRYGPVTLALDALQTRQFNSDDLERGNASKGLISGVGDGSGMWRLELKTSLDINPQAYIRTPDAFVTSMHQPAGPPPSPHPGPLVSLPNPLMVSYVPFFNPGSNTAIRSLLRVINPNARPVEVLVDATDDSGNHRREVTFPLAANSAIQISAQTLEEGNAPLREGWGIGDGEGKWRLHVRGGYRASDDDWIWLPLHVMSLLSTPSGHLTNLSR